MSDFEENDDFMCDDEEDYGLVSTNNSEYEIHKKTTASIEHWRWEVNVRSERFCVYDFTKRKSTDWLQITYFLVKNCPIRNSKKNSEQ